MSRWLVLLVIGAVVMSGLGGCVLVVGDDEIAHEVQIERGRSRLARDIQRDIDRDELLSYSDLRVREADGIVRLSGHVDSLAALQRAIDIAVRSAEVEDLELDLRLDIDD